MSYKRVETLGELARWGLHLRISCAACGRTRIVYAARLIGRFRADKKWRDIGGSMRCKGEDLVGGGCGHRGAVVSLVTDPPDPEGPPSAPTPGGGNVIPLRPRGIEPEVAPLRRRANRSHLPQRRKRRLVGRSR